MTDILMPKLSDSMERGTIISWFKADGETVRAGEELLEIETDKSTAPYEAEADGVLEVLAPVGATVEVGAVIARLSAEAHAAAAALDEEPVLDEELALDAEPVRAETPAPAAAPARAGETAPPADAPGRRAGQPTPLARRVATAHGVALETVTGSGPLGRITRSDVLRAAGAAAPSEPDRPVWAPTPRLSPRPAADAPARPPAPAPNGSVISAASPGARRQELSRLQQLIARRMAEATATVPHFQVQTEVTMDAALEHRAQLRRVAREGDRVPSVNDLIVKASALALRSHPLANGSYRDDGFELHERINIGVAVAAQGALVVPTVFDAATKSLGEIAAEVARLAARVRAGTISPTEL
ncbi:MAG TPA: dihydrolipoamide acetyltransferase family protein, partial [Solirubrobacteraceae bacterium]|nr:dihydrolipoamide acetyltransferase family protein [Solirubrobacteraceae bacterium]